MLPDFANYKNAEDFGASFARLGKPDLEVIGKWSGCKIREEQHRQRYAW
jgi:hypothetical protein